MVAAAEEVVAMTPRERFMNALGRREVDRTPVANPTSLVTVELQERLGVYFPEANYEPEPMAELALAGHTVCGYDVVFPVFAGGTHEAEALGAVVRAGDRQHLPAVRKPLWKHPDEIRIPDDFLDRPTIKVVIEAIRLLKQEVGERVAIIGKVYGPWSLGYHSFGLSEFLISTIKDPAKVDAILERLTNVTLQFARAQIEAGADALTFGDHITADLIRPDAYPRFLLGIHQEMSRIIDVPLIFHCCGKTSDRIEYFNENGMTAFHFESANDAFEMKANARMVLVGNINNTRTLLEGTAEDVRREVFYALDAGVDIIAPECAVPLDCKLENTRAIRDSVDEYHALHGRGPFDDSPAAGGA